MEVSTDEHDDGLRVRRDVATHRAVWEHLRAPVDGLPCGARVAPRRHFDSEEGVRGKNDQRVRLQLDRVAVADDQSAGAREIVVKPGRVNTAQFEAIALADEAFRQPDEPHHQGIEESLEIRRGDGHEWPAFIQ